MVKTSSWMGITDTRFCVTYGLPFRVAPIELESREHARLWIEENQLGRRNLTDDQRAMIAQAVMERRSALTPKRTRKPWWKKRRRGQTERK
jgi:hypothetical protein